MYIECKVNIEAIRGAGPFVVCNYIAMVVGSIPLEGINYCLLIF